MHSSLQVYDGSIYIAYYHPDNSSINLMSNESGDWKSTTVIPDVTSETRPSFVIDSMGTMHLSYYRQLIGEMRLYYASKIWEWSIDMTVDASGIGNGIRSSILVDSDEKVHISYYDATDKDLKLAGQD